MNILIGKIGKSILFDKSKWGIIGGDEMPSVFYINLAKRYPQHKFYLIGRSDLTQYRKNNISTKLSSLFDEDDDDKDIKIPNNIIDFWKNYSKEEGKKQLLKYHPEVAGTDEEDCSSLLRFFWFRNEIENSKINYDAGILIMGPHGSSNVPKRIKKVNSEEFTNPIIMNFNYSAPIVHALNVTQVPYFYINEDPRYVPCTARDLFNVEKFSFTQTKRPFSSNGRIKNYEDQSRSYTNIESFYGMPETIFFMNRKKPNLSKYKKDKMFIMALNPGGKRYDIVKDWILKYTKDSLKIYGKWPEQATKEHPDVFKYKAISEFGDDIYRYKYTMILGINNKNFITRKFWTMLYYGIIPFFHSDYDNDKLLPVPDYIRCKTPIDMWNKVKELESNPELYKKIFDELQLLVDDNFYTGNHIYDNVNKSMKKYIGFDLDE